MWQILLKRQPRSKGDDRATRSADPVSEPQLPWRWLHSIRRAPQEQMPGHALNEIVLPGSFPNNDSPGALARAKCSYSSPISLADLLSELHSWCLRLIDRGMRAFPKASRTELLQR